MKTKKAEIRMVAAASLASLCVLSASASDWTDTFLTALSERVAGLHATEVSVSEAYRVLSVPAVRHSAPSGSTGTEDEPFDSRDVTALSVGVDVFDSRIPIGLILHFR